MEGSRASWRDILAVYAVMTTTYEENGQEVVTVTDEKKDIIREVFWDMNELSARTVVEYTTYVCNIKKYLLAALYNAPSTIIAFHRTM